MLSACSNTPDKEPETRIDIYTFIDFALTLQDTLIYSYTNDFNVTFELIEDSTAIMDDIATIADRVNTSQTLTLEVINLLTQGQSFNNAYSGMFSFNPVYSTENAPFEMTTSDTGKHYMLVSSSTRLFVPGTTIKTLFHDNPTLTVAWQRSLHDHTSGNMYLNIYEVQSDGTVKRVGKPALVPASVLATF